MSEAYRITSNRYILHDSSTCEGPFLAKIPGNEHIALACAAQLRSSLDLVDPDVPESKIVLDVVKGHHSLHRYAMGHWYTHFECSETDGQDSFSSSLRQACIIVSDRHAHLLECEGRQSLDITSKTLPPPRVEVIKDLPVYVHLRGEALRGAQRSGDVAHESQYCHKTSFRKAEHLLKDSKLSRESWLTSSIVSSKSNNRRRPKHPVPQSMSKVRRNYRQPALSGCSCASPLT
jgi:hypothetical protein